jgi:hypothetical protein
VVAHDYNPSYSGDRFQLEASPGKELAKHPSESINWWPTLVIITMQEVSQSVGRRIEV